MNSKLNIEEIGVYDGRNYVIKDPKLREQFFFKALVIECPPEPNEYGYYLPLLYMDGMMVRKGIKRKVEPGEVLHAQFSRYDKNDRVSIR